MSWACSHDGRITKDNIRTAHLKCSIYMHITYSLRKYLSGFRITSYFCIMKHFSPDRTGPTSCMSLLFGKGKKINLKKNKEKNIIFKGIFLDENFKRFETTEENLMV